MLFVSFEDASDLKLHVAGRYSIKNPLVDTFPSCLQISASWKPTQCFISVPCHSAQETTSPPMRRWLTKAQGRHVLFKITVGDGVKRKTRSWLKEREHLLVILTWAQRLWQRTEVCHLRDIVGSLAPVLACSREMPSGSTNPKLLLQDSLDMETFTPAFLLGGHPILFLLTI